MDQSIREIGNDKQLFLDQTLAANSRQIKLVMNRPARTGEILLEPSEIEQREGLQIGSYSSVYRENGRTRIWYFANHQNHKSRRRLCYAESTDGIHFTRPSLDSPVNGGLQPPNAVIGDPVQGGSVWLDPKAPPEHRYRTQAKWGPDTGHEKDSGMQFYASPDGLQWQPTHFLDKSKIGACDTQTVVFFDERYNRYIMYTRDWVRFEDRNLSYRRVRRLESDNLIDWEKERIVLEADELDLGRCQTSVGKPPVDYYGACVFKYPEAGDFYIMLAQPFWHWQDRPETQKWGYSPDPENMDRRIVHLGPAVIDSRLGYSRDGLVFEHAISREPFLGVGPAGSFDSRMTWILPDPIVRDDDIWFYYSGGNRDHDGFLDPAASERRSGIGRAVLRRDGFASAEADQAGGNLTTPALKFNPGQLELNVAASAGGSVRVEILDLQNQPLAGFSGDDSPQFCDDAIRLPVYWRTGEIARLAGRPVKFKFHLQEAKLYSFQVKN